MNTATDTRIMIAATVAGTWRGEDARRIKGELKAMLGDK